MIIVFIGIGLIQQLLDFTPGVHLFFIVAPPPPYLRNNWLWYPWGQDPTMSYALQAVFALASGACDSWAPPVKCRDAESGSRQPEWT